MHAVWSPVLSQLERTPQDLSLRWAQLTALSEERLLRFAVLPVLLGSALQAPWKPEDMQGLIAAREALRHAVEFLQECAQFKVLMKPHELPSLGSPSYETLSPALSVSVVHNAGATAASAHPGGES